MKRFSNYLCAAMAMLLALGSASCRNGADEVMNPTTIEISSPSTQFEVFWQLIDRGYVFFADDEKDWDAVYDELHPQFVALDKRDSIPTSELIELYKKAVTGMLDHHMTITIKNEWAPPSEVQEKKNVFMVGPAGLELRQRDYFRVRPSNLQLATDKEDMYAAMEANGMMTRRKSGMIAVENLHITSGRLDGNIAYLHFSIFELQKMKNDTSKYVKFFINSRNEQVDMKSKPIEAFNQYMADIKSADLKGIVIDLRHNMGGRVDDLQYIACPLTAEKYTFGYTRHKQGLGRLDLSEWSPMYINPMPEVAARKDVPVVVLINMYSCSMGEMTPLALRSRPGGCCVIGERSFGGMGPLDDDAPLTHYGAPTKSADGSVDCYTSTYELVDANFNLLEGKGLTPDIWVTPDDAKAAAGHDPQIEAAINYINGKQ